MASCKHVDAAGAYDLFCAILPEFRSKLMNEMRKIELRPPGPNQAVYREDCTQCFDSIVSTAFCINLDLNFDSSTRTIRPASMFASTASMVAVLGPGCIPVCTKLSEVTLWS